MSIIAFILFWTINLNAQTHPLKPLYQLFTSSTCAPCYSGNLMLDGILNDNPEEYSLIKYQVNWPGSGDPYYTSEVGVRKNYYNVSGVPTLFIETDNLNPYDMTQSIFDDHIGGMTAMEIQINTAEINEAGMINLEFAINVENNYPTGLTLHTVVVERITTQNVGGNYETEFHNVMMKMLPDAYGSPLGMLTPASPSNFSFDYDMEQTNMEQASDLALIIFVQDNTDKSIIQSEMVNVTPLFDTYEINFTIEDCAGNQIEDASLFLQGIGTLISDENGAIYYEGLSAGTYQYSVEAIGLYPASGTVTITDESIFPTVSLELPTSLFFEDFTNDIPSSWAVYAGESSDYLYTFEGEVIFFKQSSGSAPIILASPELNIESANKIMFDLGNSDGVTQPHCGFGYLTDITDPNSYVELEDYAVGTNMETIEYDLNDFSMTDVYFAWKHNGGIMTGSFYSLDNVKLDGEIIPFPPGNLSFASFSGDAFLLTWDQYGGYGKSFDTFEGFNVYFSLNESDFEVVESALMDTSYLHPWGVDGEYHYFITATVDGVESSHSDTISEVLVGIQPQSTKKINIFSVPMNNELIIKSEVQLDQVKIYDVMGKLLVEKEANQKSLTLDVSTIKTGIYLVWVKSENRIVSKKVFIE